MCPVETGRFFTPLWFKDIEPLVVKVRRPVLSLQCGTIYELVKESFTSLPVYKNRYLVFGNNKRPSNRCCMCYLPARSRLEEHYFTLQPVERQHLFLIFFTFFIFAFLLAKTALSCELRIIQIETEGCKRNFQKFL